MEKYMVFLIDVDNTLLDNDHIKEEIKHSLILVLGEKEAMHFWHHHDNFRDYKKLVDFPNIIHIYCAEMHKDTCDTKLHRIFDSIEFAHALYPEAKNVLTHLKTLGKVALFTEGDSIFQKMKIEKSGLAKLVDEVLLYEHKWENFAQIIRQYKDSSIILIDDRADALAKVRLKFPQVFTVEVCQGHYAAIDHKIHEELDIKINSISEILKFNNKTLHDLLTSKSKAL